MFEVAKLVRITVLLYIVWILISMLDWIYGVVGLSMCDMIDDKE